MLGTQQNYYVPKLEIIAEAGCNHCGDRELMLRMVKVASECGANKIKFQAFRYESLVGPDPEVLDFCKKSQLTFEDYTAIIDECTKQNIDPLFSVFDKDSLEIIDMLGFEEVKIPSGQMFNQELLALAAQKFRKIYASTGMSAMEDVTHAYETMINNGREPSDIVLMQCTTSYPAPHTKANLLVLERYRDLYKTIIGYSDHTHGWVTSIAAVALGATVIEKHFILEPADVTPDSGVSLNQTEFAMMVDDLCKAVVSRGTPVKRIQKCEEGMLKRRDYGGNNELR